MYLEELGETQLQHEKAVIDWVPCLLGDIELSERQQYVLDLVE